MGEVYLAQAKGLGGATAPVQDGTENNSNLGVVMVKALNHTRDEASLLEFRRQLDMFQRVDHPNIVSLLGLCREQDPHYMLLQYSDWVCKCNIEYLLLYNFSVIFYNISFF